MNRGHKQIDVIVLDFAKIFDKILHKTGYCTNLTFTGLEDLYIRERPFDFMGGAGLEDVFGPGYLFHSRCSPVF